MNRVPWISAAAFLSIAAASAAESNRQFVDRYCLTCHNDHNKSGGLSLTAYDAAHADAAPDIWEKAAWKVRAGLMPPPRAPHPDATAARAFAASLEDQIDRAAMAHPNPGRAPLRRLSNTEYANAIRDLLNLEIDASAYLPPVEASSMSMESYVRAAAKIARDAVGDPAARASVQTYHVPAARSQHDHIPGAPFGTRGGLVVRHNFPADGEYRFKVAYQLTDQGLLFGANSGANEQLEVAVDGARVALLDVDPKLTINSAAVQTPAVLVTAGPHVVSAAFLQQSDGPLAGLIQPSGRGLRAGEAGATPGLVTLPYLRDFGIDGPYHATGVSDTPSRRKIFVCRPTARDEELPCATKILGTLARQAFRRPVSAEDLESPLELFRTARQDGDFDAAIRTALQLILAHPQFTFLFEPVPEGLSQGTNFPVGGLALASRLSFFLWSSLPDGELIDLAATGKLEEPWVFTQQVTRMLADPRSEALSLNFAAQWLGLRDLQETQRDPALFPGFDRTLADSMRRETELFFDSIARENRSVRELLTADYTFVNEPLARHYGISGVNGSHFRRVQLEGENRRGLLGQGSLLTLTSLTDRTSPVTRGKKILEELLGVTPPPPPANVPPLQPSNPAAARSVRERTEEHRRNEPCFSCHSLMDPLGFALENFDATGAWRTHEARVPIDSAGTLYDGSHIEGPAGLRQALLNRSDLFVRNFVTRLLAYALGRPVDSSMQPFVRAIEREAAKDDYRFRSIVMAITSSVPFRMSRAEDQ